jgi:WD40 repeat protein
MLDGLAHSVTFHPSDGNIFFASTSKKTIHGIDRRGGEEESNYSLENDSIVNTVLVAGDNLLLSGDSRGMIKTWDLRMRKVVGKSLSLSRPPASLQALTATPCSIITTEYDPSSARPRRPLFVPALDDICSTMLTTLALCINTTMQAPP